MEPTLEQKQRLKTTSTLKPHVPVSVAAGQHAQHQTAVDAFKIRYRNDRVALFQQRHVGRQRQRDCVDCFRKVGGLRHVLHDEARGEHLEGERVPDYGLVKMRVREVSEGLYVACLGHFMHKYIRVLSFFLSLSPSAL